MVRVVRLAVVNVIKPDPISYLSRRSLFIADGARRIYQPQPIGLTPSNLEKPILHALTIRSMIVDYLKHKSPAELSMYENTYLLKLFDSYDAAVTLIEDEELREQLTYSFAFPNIRDEEST